MTEPHSEPTSDENVEGKPPPYDAAFERYCKLRLPLLSLPEDTVEDLSTVAHVLAYTGGLSPSSAGYLGKIKWSINYARSWVRSDLCDIAVALRIRFKGERGDFGHGKHWKVREKGGLLGVGLRVVQQLREEHAKGALGEFGAEEPAQN